MQIANAPDTALFAAKPDEAPLSRLKALAHGGSKTQIDKAAQDFEAMFLSQMLAPVFKGIKTDGLFGGGHGEDAFRSMLYDDYAKEIAKSGGIGIADAVRNELLKYQSSQSISSSVQGE